MFDRLNLATVILSGTVLVGSTLAPNSASVAVELGAGTAIRSGSCYASNGVSKANVSVGTNIATFQRGVGQFRHVDVKVSNVVKSVSRGNEFVRAEIVRNGVVVDSQGRSINGSRGFVRIPSGGNAKFRRGENVDVRVSFSGLAGFSSADEAFTIRCTADLGFIF